MVRFTPGLLLFFCFRIAFAQEAAYDSLERVIQSGHTSDTNRVNALNLLSIRYWYKDNEKAYELTRRALDIAENCNFRRGMAVSNNLMGVLFDIKSEFDSALFYYSLSVKYSRETGYLKILASAYNNIGMVHKSRGNFQESIKAYYDALRIFEKQHDRKDIGNTYNNLGLVYYELKQYRTSLDFHFKSLRIMEEINDQYGIGASLTNIGLAYSNLNEPEKARDYYLKSLRIKEELGDKYGLGILLNNLALLYLDSRQYEKALSMYLRAEKYHREIEDLNGLISTFINISSVYQRMNNIRQAENMIDSARLLATELKTNTRLAKVYEAYAHLYGITANYKMAYKSYRILDSIKDSIYSENMSRNITEISTKYQTEKKENEINLLQKENRIKKLEISRQKDRNRNQLLAAAILFVLTVSGLALWYIRSKYRLKVQTEKEKLVLQKEAYTAVVNAEEGERKRIAMELHDGLGQVLSAARLNVSVLEDLTGAEDREVVTNAESLIDQAITDLRNISHNLMPSALIRLGLVAALNDMAEKINTGRQVKMTVTTKGLDNRLPEDFEIAIYRVVQEAVNNILKHAGASAVNVSLIKNQENLNLEIADNGSGMPQEAEKKSKGIGWEDIRSRVSLFNGKMKLYSRPGEGTRININFSKLSV